MFLQRSQDAQPALQTPGVVIHNVILNHLYQLLAVGKTPSVVALSLQDAPEPFHGAVVNAFGYARHALSHSSGCKFGVEGAVGVLESSVGVYQRMCIRIKCNCFVKGLKYQGIVITVTNYKRHNTAVIEVKNCAEINFPDLRSNLMIAGHEAEAASEVEVLREEANDVVLKVIIESGALKSPELIRRASLVSMFAGADFVKTSTGKIDVAATPEAAFVMCHAIKDYYNMTGRKVGFKAAGGVRTPEDAALYYTIVEEVLGDEWLTTDLFRIGASSAANNLISAIEDKDIKYF